ncbi:hypothetical protein F4Z99_06645 [Candidatus Poribacteria bacterium]|nr:hypothetical protein [Candidatus Poribacteria bacterium]MYA98520.1 hypothetical protein [Candidatus Poribacteria bacterium]
MQTTFTPENFQKAFKPYLVRWGVVYTILISLVTIVTVCIIIPNWGFSQWLVSLFMDTGAMFDGKTISYGIFAMSILIFGIIVAGINVIGAFAFGMNACGIVAIGGNAVGIIAIGGNAFGVVAVGYNAFGIYALSYSQRSRGKYLFAPHRQDLKAVALFTRWFPKLTESGIQDNNT